MNNAEKTARILLAMNPFYVLTTEGDCPKGRPNSYFILRDDRIYFATGKFKNYYRQLQENPNVEVLASKGLDFIRYDGKAVVVTDDELYASLDEQIHREATHMAQIYTENDWQFGFFYLEDGHVELRHSLDLVEEYDV